VCDRHTDDTSKNYQNNTMSGTKMLAIPKGSPRDPLGDEGTSVKTALILIPVFILVMFPIVLTVWLCWYLFTKKTPDRRSSRSMDVAPNDVDIIVTHDNETNVI
jgi:hypothetical protein